MMRRIAVVVFASTLLALGSCASTKPCPAYAQSMDNTEVRG
jgi:hypothetical protein